MSTEIKEKLTPAVRARVRRWIHNLESGKYKQGRNKLRVGDKFCCLGVACDMLAKTKKGVWVDKDSGEKRFDILWKGHKEYGSVTRIPTEFAPLFGLDQYDLSTFHGQSKYMIMNDEGRSFLEVAAQLRKDFGFKPRVENESV